MTNSDEDTDDILIHAEREEEISRRGLAEGTLIEFPGGSGTEKGHIERILANGMLAVSILGEDITEKPLIQVEPNKVTSLK